MNKFCIFPIRFSTFLCDSLNVSNLSLLKQGLGFQFRRGALLKKDLGRRFSLPSLLSFKEGSMSSASKATGLGRTTPSYNYLGSESGSSGGCPDAALAKVRAVFHTKGLILTGIYRMFGYEPKFPSSVG